MNREGLRKILRGKCVTDEACEAAIDELLNLHSVSFSLPTDDEIIEKHNSLKTVHGEVLKHTKDKLHRVGFYRGARWVRELINNES